MRRLTAFVARFFKQAQRHMNAIEDRIINKALDWIIEKQAADGSFSEVTDAALTSPEGRSAERVPLTAYVLLAFLEDKRLQPLYELSVKMAVEFLTRNLLRSKNFLYSLAMNTYILHLTDSSDDGLKQASFRYLQAKVNKTGKLFPIVSNALGNDIYKRLNASLRWRIPFLGEWWRDGWKLVTKYWNNCILFAYVPWAWVTCWCFIHSAMVGGAAQLKRRFRVNSGNIHHL